MLGLYSIAITFILIATVIHYEHKTDELVEIAKDYYELSNELLERVDVLTKKLKNNNIQ